MGGWREGRGYCEERHLAWGLGGGDGWLGIEVLALPILLGLSQVAFKFYEIKVPCASDMTALLIGRVPGCTCSLPMFGLVT